MKKILILLLLFLSQAASALPSFTRQTGQACSACHIQSFGPSLNSYGRQFKLMGYTQGSGDSLLSRFGGMAEGSVSNLKRDDPSLGNNNLVLDQASVFYGGRVIDHLGAFIQTTYDGVANSFAWDNTDIRLVDQNEFFNQEVQYGLSFNNNPTSQDLWNTTPAWGFPYASSKVTNNPAAGPILASLGGQVGGATAYTMIANTVFLEAGAYTSFARYAQKGMGHWDPSSPNFTANSGAVKITGGAPYWRIGLQKEWQGHYFSLGHFGFQANVRPDITVPGTDQYTDLGTDFNYQYLANPRHIYEFKASYIREHQQLNTSFNQSLTSAVAPSQQIDFLGLNGSYTFDQTYSASIGYNHSYGNSDSGLWSVTNRPNSEYFTFELDYIPFGKTPGAGLSSYLNLRFAAQYVAYTMFDGAIKNYDGNGRNASDNNTLYFNGWLSF